MNYHVYHPLQPFWNIAAAPIQTEALEQALVIGLFNHLRKPASADAIAKNLQLDLVATTVWLDLLWSMELLSRRITANTSANVEYVTAPLALQYFVEGSAQNCAQSWQYRARFMERFAKQWKTILREGFKTQSQVTPNGSWAQAAREQIGQEQRVVTVPAVMNLFDTLPSLPETGRFLDLGGGPGHVGIALAQRLPSWSGVLCDDPETAVVAQENLEAAGLSQRVRALGCDLNADDIGCNYDLIWCSSVIHFLLNQQALITKASKALNSGGLLLMAHAEQNDDPEVVARLLPFYSSVVLRGKFLPYQGQMVQMMTEAGLADVQSLGRIDFPMAPVWVYTGRKR